jgi:hypothetical protein
VTVKPGGRRSIEHYGPYRDRCRDPVACAVFASRRRAGQRSEEQRERSREEFGSEYERTVEERGSEEAERELRERRGRVEQRVEPLSEEDRGRFEEQWGEVERVFVENPRGL